MKRSWLEYFRQDKYKSIRVDLDPGSIPEG